VFEPLGKNALEMAAVDVLAAMLTGGLSLWGIVTTDGAKTERAPSTPLSPEEGWLPPTSTPQR